MRGKRELINSESDEVELSESFFDLAEKYSLITAKIHVPARISCQKSDELKAAAKTIMTRWAAGALPVWICLSPQRLK